MTATASPPRGSAKRQRLILAGVAAAVLALAGTVGAIALQDTAAYFKAPGDFVTDPPAAGQTIRLGGLVKDGSIRRSPDGLTMYFVVADNRAELPVRYTGLVPDLFREGQGVVATGVLAANGEFEARELLAKHDENYMPPEVAKAMKKGGHPMDAPGGSPAA